MIRFTVLWGERAEAELIELWSDTRLRREITAAVDILDEELRVDAHQKSVPISKDFQAIGRSLVTLYFRIDEADRKVLVVSIQLTKSD